jgi:hypothetical protein
LLIVKPDAPGVPKVKKVGYVILRNFLNKIIILKILSIRKRFVDLTWEAPLNDGGSKVSGKIIYLI